MGNGCILLLYYTYFYCFLLLFCIQLTYTQQLLSSPKIDKTITTIYCSFSTCVSYYFIFYFSQFTVRY